MHQETRKPNADRPANELAYGALVESIISGRYAPGQRLREADLISELSVSRGPIREALRRLEAESLIRAEPHRGYVVRWLSREELSNTYDLLEVIGGLCARRATEVLHHDKAGRVALKAALTELKALSKDADIMTFVEASSRWRELLESLSRNQILPGVVAQLRRPLVQLQIRLMIRQRFVPEMIADYEKVTKTVLAGNPKKAEEAMRDHIRRAANLIATLPDNDFNTRA